MVMQNPKEYSGLFCCTAPLQRSFYSDMTYCCSSDYIAGIKNTVHVQQ